MSLLPTAGLILMSCASGVDPGLLLLLVQKTWSQIAKPASSLSMASLPLRNRSPFQSMISWECGLSTLWSLRCAHHMPWFPSLPWCYREVFLIWQRHRSTSPRYKCYESKLLSFVCEMYLQIRYDMLYLLYFRVTKIHLFDKSFICGTACAS